ncbi:unnamed protein product [Hyaloperonospora brassicae]|uniref:Peptidase A1 domain-containing protein n=1 Tax=Hyaloperonospora brassicae TaxID=162125 RepID=A0AAV0T956_HYABA|nr:unnamed protein product [Hyaloperonospora brassicae]
MLRPFTGVHALVAIALALPTRAEDEQATGFTMQLHRMPRHNRQPARYARRLGVEEDGPELVPLHLGLGTHYTWLYAGTPPQRASVIVDTGSALLAFPCSGCNGCGNHTDVPFNADNSSTLVHVKCSQKSFYRCKECKLPSDTCAISQSYLEGSSWKASVVEDVVYLGGDSSFDDDAMRSKYGTRYQFGCQNVETGLFVTQVADGIMGLSRTDDHIVAKLYHEKKIPSNLFSLCFIENGGTMSVGQPHKAAHRGEIAYVKMIVDGSPSHLYNLPVKDIRIGGKSINAKAESYTQGHFIVDSGTTDSYLPKSMEGEFMKMFREVAGRDYQVEAACKGYTNEELSLLPTIQFVMEAEGGKSEEVILSVPPEQYLLRDKGKYCGGIHLTENSGGVIGANLMTNRDMIFDSSNQRIGFVDADCAWQETSNSTATSSAMNKTTKISEGKEKEKAATTIAIAPGGTSVVKSTPAPAADAASKDAGTPTPPADAASEDAGTPAPPADAASEDAGTPAPPADAASEDAGTPAPPADAASKDAGTPTPLADAASEDAGTPAPPADAASEDAGTPAPPADVASEDAGTPAPPADAASEDAGTPAPLADAASEDAGTPAPMANATSTPASTTVSAELATKTMPTVEATMEPATPEPAMTSADTSQTTLVTNISSVQTASRDADPELQTVPDDMAESSSATATVSSKSKGRSFGTHPMVLTLVGAILVVGFLLMVVLSVRRRRRKTGNKQLWSRVEGDEEDEDVQDEEEFGLAFSDKKALQGTPTTKHQRLKQDDRDDDDNDDDHDRHQERSSDEDDDVFACETIQEEPEVDTSTLDRL